MSENDLSKALLNIGRYVPGTLVTTITENEDVDNRVGIPYGSVENGFIRFKYGDMMTVISHEVRAGSFVNEVNTYTYVLHHRLQKLVFVFGIEKRGWLRIVG